MNNDFNQRTGSWPESYFFADKDGVCLWKSIVDTVTHEHHLNGAKEFAD